MDKVFKAYDVRGTVPDQLDADMCLAIGRAMARFAGTPEILVARDMRETGVELSRAFSDGVRAEGVDVTDLGMASTDFLYFASGHLDAPGRHVHGVAQSGAVQRTQDVPLGRAPDRARHRPGRHSGGGREAAGGAGPAAPGPDASWTCSAEWADHVVSLRRRAPCGRSRSWPTRPTAWAGSWCRSSSSGCPSPWRSSSPSSTGTFPNHPADPIQPENLVASEAGRARAGRRHRPGLRRGRRPGLPRRREGRAGVRLAHHGTGGGLHADQAPGRDGPLQPHLLARGARGRHGDGGHRRSGPRWATPSSRR